MSSHSHIYKTLGWGVHLLTASAAVVGLFTLWEITQQHYLLAFFFMGIAVLIDAIDGTLARRVHVKTFIPSIDGALLDNMVDFINYVLTPCFFILNVPSLFLQGTAPYIASFIVIVSCYQFTQSDAKTTDHFFKGFPSYWNFVIFYMFAYHTSELLNTTIILILGLLVFVPIKYVYLSRMDHVVKQPALRKLIMLASIILGLAGLAMIATYPTPHPILLIYTLLYSVFYFSFSIYRTWVPLKK